MRPAFHIYIDEAGDPGVKSKESDEPHWSDWFVISAVVVANENDPKAVDWVQEMNQSIRRKGPADIHYRKLSDTNRHHVCRVLADKPVRIFSIASHKQSMRSHRSQKLGRATDKEFYNWCLRLLLERVTEWCARRSLNAGIEIEPARIVFSERGGHDYRELMGYLKKLEAQTLTGNLTLGKRGIVRGVIHESLCEVIPHSNLAGLQLADVAASAFFQAANTASPRFNLGPAVCLLPRLARREKERKPNGFGLLLLPFPHQGDIPTADRQIFEMCGYSFCKK